MDTKSLIRKTYKTHYSLVEIVAWIGYAAVIAIVLIVFIDVCGRYFFNSPLRGSFELVEQTMVISGGFAIIYTTLRRGHIIIDIIFDKLPRRIRVVLNFVFSLLGFFMTAAMAYYVYLFGLRQLNPYPQVTTILKMPMAPFQLGLAVALALCSIVFLMQTLQLWTEGYTDEREESSL